MSHSLYRVLTPENYDNDWVVICISSAGINNVGCGPKIKKFFEFCDKHHAVSMGSNITSDLLVGSREAFFALDWEADNIMAGQACFDCEQDVAGLLKDMKEADLGLSVVVSGLIDRVDHICKCVGTKHHTISNSLGVWGDTSKLPPRDVMAITTMCGHGMISANRVYDAIEKIRKGRTTAEKASLEMAKDCVCGILNSHRCAKLLTALAAQTDAEETPDELR